LLRAQILRVFQQIPAGRRAILLVWQATRGWTVLWALLLLLQGLIPAFVVLLLRTLINRLAQSQPWVELLPPAIGIATLWFGAVVASSALSYVRTVQAEKVQNLIHSLLHEKVASLDLSFFDSASSYDLLHRARIDAISQPTALLENLGAMLQNSLSFLVLATILARYTILLPILLVGCGLPGLLLVARQILREHHWNRTHTSEERQSRYLDWVICDQSSAAELRIYSLGSLFRERFARLRGGLAAGKISLAAQSSIAELLAASLAWAGTLVGLGIMLYRSHHGLAGLGDLLLCLQAFQQAQTQLRTLLEGGGKIFRSLLFIENLDLFLKIEPEIVAGDRRSTKELLKESIRFEDVSFSYPGCDRLALERFNIEIPAGKVVALVGQNGAGKSTLIKLLCRFYDPSSGRILIDGVDLREFDPNDFRQQLAVLFQEPVRYQARARENISFGDVTGIDDMERTAEAAEAAGATEFLNKLPKGMETYLGKWFGGSELSGGEWQRVALARAFFRQAALVILDEPTSAMDSWAEQDWLRRFRTLTEGRTGLMITHRFTTAMHADIIHVLDKGKIVESGTHQQLVDLGGSYYRSWSAQISDYESKAGAI